MVRNGSITTGFALVILGILLLLNTLGFLNWAVWPYLLRWWPVFLIALGLELVFCRRLFLLLAAIMILVGAAFYIYSGQPNSWHHYFMWNERHQSLPLFRWQQELPDDIEANRYGLDFTACHLVDNSNFEI